MSPIIEEDPQIPQESSLLKSFNRLALQTPKYLITKDQDRILALGKEQSKFGLTPILEDFAELRLQSSEQMARDYR